MSGADTSLEQYLGDVLRGSAKILGCDSTNLILLNEKTREIRIRLGTMARSLPLLNQREQVLGESLKQAAFSTRDAADSLAFCAGEGTVFLDEIGDMMQIQGKLLRVLESRSFRRVGSTRELALKARVVAATNQDLQAMVKQGRFRHDLYQRLTVDDEEDQ